MQTCEGFSDLFTRILILGEVIFLMVFLCSWCSHLSRFPMARRDHLEKTQRMERLQKLMKEQIIVIEKIIPYSTLQTGPVFTIERYSLRAYCRDYFILVKPSGLTSKRIWKKRLIQKLTQHDSSST